MKFVLFFIFAHVAFCEGQNGTGTVVLGPTASAPRIIKIGAMFPRGITSLDSTISYSRTAGGLTVGMKRLLNYTYWPDNINFT